MTGGSAGIGLATVEQLCLEDASVVFSSNEREDGVAVETRLRSAGHRVRFCHGDMADEDVCATAVQEAVKTFGGLQLLVNNAFSFLAKGLDATYADWKRTMDVGPIAYATMARLAAEPIRRSGGGAIVNVSSISAHIAQPNRWTYNAAKGAVHTLTKCMALDLAAWGIRVNSVSPAWIWTREVDKAAQGDRSRWEPVWGQFHMLGRCGEPLEVARSILFLLSDDASFITAADLAVDGGYLGLGSEGLGKSSQFVGSR